MSMNEVSHAARYLRCGDKPWVRGIDQTVSDKARLVHYSQKICSGDTAQMGLAFPM